MPVTTTTHRRVGLAPVFMATSILIWISAVIVMGILSYLISLNNNVGDHIIYEEVVAVLTVALFLAAFFVASIAGLFMLFNVIFSYLWIVVVAFTFSEFTYSQSALLHTVQAFSFIAL
jgi:hypothetical protein